MAVAVAPAATAPPPRVYTIPVADDEPIIISSNDLPEDSNELADVLLTVNAKLNLWFDFLLEYYRHGKIAEYEKLLQRTLSLRKYYINFTPILCIGWRLVLVEAPAICA